MGAIYCLVKAELPLHQCSSQNDDRKGQTFSEGVEKEEIGQIQIIGGSSSVLWKKINASIKRRNQRGAPQKSKKRPLANRRVEAPFSKAGFFSQKRRFIS